MTPADRSVTPADALAVLLAEALEGIATDPALAARFRTSLAALLPSPPAVTAPVPVDEWLPVTALPGTPARTARKAISAGQLCASKVGRELRIRRSDHDAWVARQRITPRNAPAPVSEPGEAELMAERTIAEGLASGRLRVLAGRRRR